ncbi:uncharacterized protein LOC112185103 [Rosa chinensis]|uniref:uncharacterized protein LOC112185103 n=1 Tax=Rosa chinensis TaxID=74649 RepID=UPI000D0912B5|nr:uncharacterized protein LOC112185103 [Rosa chinensis]
MIALDTDRGRPPEMVVAAVAAIVRNASGHMIAGSNMSLYAFSAIAAEALTIIEGLSLAASLNISSFILESDSAPLIPALNLPKYSLDWTAAPLFWKIRSLSESFTSISWLWSSRQANQAADFVAALASRRMCPVDWVSNPPSSFLALLSVDSSHILSQDFVPSGFDVG